MAQTNPYPLVAGPYGYKPVNLIGGQVYAGSTRNMAIQYNSATPIYFGDLVTLSSGYATLITYPLTATNTTVGVFLGCYYTNPTTKQRLFSQYYPGNVTAGDITAIVADDPDIVIQTAVVASAGSTTIASASSLLVGSNMAGTTNTGSASTGNSLAGVVAASAAAATTTGLRVLSLVPDTQVTSSGTVVSYTTSATAGANSISISGLTLGQIIPLGTDVFKNVNGQLQFTGATTSASTTVSSITAQTINTISLNTNNVSTLAASDSLALIQTPEVLVKLNFGTHRYNIA
jgi:hypothetical protein